MSTMDRRQFFGSAGVAAFGVASGAVRGPASLPSPLDRGGAAKPWRIDGSADDWDVFRAQFDLDPTWVHLAGLLIASHPRPVADAIERHRQALDSNPAIYLHERRLPLEMETRAAAARYLGVEAKDLALTDSTTLGIALVYAGLQVRPGQELLTTSHDYFVTHESLMFKANRTGASFRMVEPFRSAAQATADEITDTIMGEVRAQTRVLGLTWVQSWTGLKIPVRRIADRLAELNADREPADRVLLGLDAVHGLGVEDDALPDLGCDFFMAGTHKWIFGPRGTGVLWGRPETQGAVTPTVPTFSLDPAWGDQMTPGGYKAFEHRWAVAEAFDMHMEIGKTRIRDRIRELNTQLKEGLAAMSHVRVRTPMDPALSAGIVAFDVEGFLPDEVVARLEERKVIASTGPYAPTYARLTPGLLNTPADIETALAAVRALA
jgi:selenocysteine lyase/cysteine desulfurase